jgi:hypothetical protein
MSVKDNEGRLVRDMAMLVSSVTADSHHGTLSVPWALGGFGIETPRDKTSPVATS